MRNILLSNVALLAMFGSSSFVWAQQESGSSYEYGPHMWGGGPWMLIMPLMMIVFIAGIVAVVLLMVRRLGGSGYGTAQHPLPGRAPLDILKERLARGEIQKEEFEELQRALGE